MTNKEIYKLVMCSKFEEIEGREHPDFGTKDEVGIFDNKEMCIDILKTNAMDVCSTVYDYAYIETIHLNVLYFGNGDKEVYKVEDVTIKDENNQEFYNPNCHYEYVKTLYSLENKIKHGEI